MKKDDEEPKGGPEDKPSEETPKDEQSLPAPDASLTSETENRQPGEAKDLEEKEVQVIGVYEHQEQGLTPGFSPPAFVLLRDKQGRQVLIFIGRPEAFAISLALEERTADRPLTHDLMKSLVDRLGGRIERILIDDIWQDTYYAKIGIAMNGNSLQVDARPSDAIALALRAKAPIFMAEYVLQQASVGEEPA